MHAASTPHVLGQLQKARASGSGLLYQTRVADMYYCTHFMVDRNQHLVRQDSIL